MRTEVDVICPLQDGMCACDHSARRSLRRDSPQAPRSRHCRAGRLILSLLIPGCSVAGDQEASKFPVRARCRVGVRNASLPDRGRDLPCRALGKTDSGGGWLRVQLEQPGVLLLPRLCPRRAEGSVGRHVRTHWFGHAHLVDMPVIVRHKDRGALRLDHRHDQALCRRRAVI